MLNLANTKIKTQYGFSLLEVMVAMVIFSIGLLGLAGLMAQSTRFTNSAQYRTQATYLAYDMLDRMRANPAQARNPTLGYNLSLGNTPGAATCYATTCTPAQLATADKDQWLTAVQALLPGGDGEVTLPTPDTNVIFVITVRWKDPVSAETAAPTSFTFRSEL